MKRGRVYIWTPDAGHGGGGQVSTAIVPLLRLETGQSETDGLQGRYVRVRNAGMVNEPVASLDGAAAAEVRRVALGAAQPDSAGDFLFEPGWGGGRVDKLALVSARRRARYIGAAHFGEVNAYYHLDRMAAYIDDLLGELQASSLPRVTAVVNAHHAAVEKADGSRDGVWCRDHWLPFQGGHYRLPGSHYDIAEHEPISPGGEIHLGPGWQLLRDGALAAAAGRPYRHNAAHNAGILYHEYGHHINRHTADFRANALREPHHQTNRKIPLDEGTCDYWAATMLGTPHIWAWHRRHDADEVHPRSLTSPKTMADYDRDRRADPHLNGTLWGAALWDVREQFMACEKDGARRTDRLVLQALLLMGQVGRGLRSSDALQPGDGPQPGATPQAALRAICRARRKFATGLTALLRADGKLHDGRHRAVILECFNRRGFRCEAGLPRLEIEPELPGENELQREDALLCRA